MSNNRWYEKLEEGDELVFGNKDIIDKRVGVANYVIKAKGSNFYEFVYIELHQSNRQSPDNNHFHYSHLRLKYFQDVKFPSEEQIELNRLYSKLTS